MHKETLDNAIAIVGQSCLLPGANSPEQLWENIKQQKPAFTNRESQGISYKYGDVSGFKELFNPNGFAVESSYVDKLDPLFQWGLHTAREALCGAKLEDYADVGVVLGNLSFPTPALCDLVRGELSPPATSQQTVHPHNRFMSGYPALLIKQALGLGGGAYCLDAACASGLYAIYNGINWLKSGQAKTVLAGAVNGADSLFIQKGFQALGAISPSGEPKPFQKDADGLVPASGAGFIAMCRLQDALERGCEIHGLILGVGISNDGRGEGLLVPSKEGQVRAMNMALKNAGLAPSQVSLIECHGTGTPLGDATEIASMESVFSDLDRINIGSLKSSIGHTITASGIAGLIKLTQAIKHGEIPCSRNTENPKDQLTNSHFSLNSQNKKWPVGVPKIAGLSAFGFGGNNAHLILGDVQSLAVVRPQHSKRTPEKIALVGIGIHSQGARSPAEFVKAAKGNQSLGKLQALQLPLKNLNFPPKDLAVASPQQLLTMLAATKALNQTELNAERTGVFMGMGIDPGSAQPIARIYAGIDKNCAWSSASILGTMPNIVANRISNQHNLKALSYTISAEELSGLVALELAVAALKNHELDAAIVGAVDLGTNPIHEQALRSIAVKGETADEALVWVLKRKTDAEHSGDKVLADIEHCSQGKVQTDAQEHPPTPMTGYSHAATGLKCLTEAIIGKKAPTDFTFKSAFGNASTTVFSPKKKNLALWEAIEHNPEGPHFEVLCQQAAARRVEKRIQGAEQAQIVKAHDQLTANHLEFLTSIGQNHQHFLSLSTGGTISKHVTRPEKPRKNLHQPQPDAPISNQSQTLPYVPQHAKEKLALSREQLEVHSSGKISDIYGPLFQQQDAYDIQVRMPMPPLLIADEVTGIDAEAGSMGTGTIWTKTFLDEDTWYLHLDRIPAGILIESGQADLMLISYLGIDFENKGKRAYRLLGCEITYFGHLPRRGDTLEWEIKIKRHAKHGGVQLFFFDSNCYVNGELRITVRNGHAGCFTDEELEDSAGVIFDPDEIEITKEPNLAAPPQLSLYESFDTQSLKDFSHGKLFECFGPGFEFAKTHSRSPSIQQGNMLLLHRISDLNPHGGPWNRGYCRAEYDIAPDDWFLPCHFHKDPCMPGTLMFEAGLQIMAFYISALGFTLDKDGFDFEPVKEQAYKLFCRGQASPQSKLLTYELFVEELEGGATPTLYADLLVCVDGLKAFHARRLALRLEPRFLLEPKPLSNIATGKSAATSGGHKFDEHALVALAYGSGSQAFGPIFKRFDSTRKGGRLPCPPFLFVSRATKLGSDVGVLAKSQEFETAFDFEPNDWFFQSAEAQSVMPFSVLLEAVLQSCGFLANYSGATLNSKQDLFFRNLDGSIFIHHPILAQKGSLLTKLKLVSQSKNAETIIQKFALAAYLNGKKIAEVNTVFGFFTRDDLDKQNGLTITDAEQQLITLGSGEPLPLEAVNGRLPHQKLVTIDKVEFFPNAGQCGLGVIKGVQAVLEDSWYFKAHFFQDPVQPGSLGLEAFHNLMRIYVGEKHDAAAEAITYEQQPLNWSYRGQVTPNNDHVITVVDIKKITDHELVADGYLWADTLPIYTAKGLRISF